LNAQASLQVRQFAQLSATELYQLLRFRQAIFVIEQGSPYPDLDGLDLRAWHLLLHVGGELAGYLRLTPMPGPPPLAKLGRVAVAPDLRRRGFGRKLVMEGLRLCREHYPDQPIALGAQCHLVPFYESFGFAAASEPYDDFGVTHVDMVMLPKGR
jgi:ElaA protein